MIADAWRLLVNSLGFHLNRRDAFRIWFYANMGKYIPGKVWFLIARYEMGQEMKIPVSITIKSIFLEMTLLLLSGLLVFLSCQQWLGQFSFSPWVFGLSLLLGLIAIHPFIVNLFFKAFSKIAINDDSRIVTNYLVMLGVLLYYICAWVIYSFGCWLAGISLGLNVSFLVFLGAFPFAWVAGYLAFITPGGLGVREETSVLLLTGAMGKPSAALITIVSRIFWMLAEIFCYLLSRLNKNKVE
jgi:uncharacterized membrane protein YbhN (UPF0104 family)